jgi:hypothetical protein
MSDAILNQDKINSLLTKIGVELRKIDPSIEIIRFGSSLQQLSNDNIDVDILLLSLIDYLHESINDSIKTLKEKLVRGEAISGFDTNVPMISDVVKGVIFSETCADGIHFIPKFVFGPFAYDADRLNGLNVYLHIKGPLIYSQFLMFCEEMPLHAWSLIENHTMILGSGSIVVFKPLIKLDEKSLELFNEGLRIRVENSTDNFDIIKCIKKLILNCRIFYGNNDIIVEGLESKELSELKSIFKDLLHINKVYI